MSSEGVGTALRSDAAEQFFAGRITTILDAFWQAVAGFLAER